MKKYPTLRPSLFLILGGLLISPTLFAATATEEIWTYVFLIPIYFVLILQCLLVLFALLMKHFKTKQSLLITSLFASVIMLLGAGITLYFEPLDKLWTLLLHYALMAIVVFVLPVVQFKLLSQSKNAVIKNQT